jgi:hypothetical protein
MNFYEEEENARRYNHQFFIEDTIAGAEQCDWLRGMLKKILGIYTVLNLHFLYLSSQGPCV